MSRLRQERIVDIAGIMGAAAGQAIATDLENKRLSARLAALEAVAAAAREMDLHALPPFADGSVVYAYEHEQWWAPQLIAALDALEGTDA